MTSPAASEADDETEGEAGGEREGKFGREAEGEGVSEGAVQGEPEGVGGAVGEAERTTTVSVAEWLTAETHEPFGAAGEGADK